MSLPTVLVTGATGAVGPVLVRRLVAQGYRVRVAARLPPPPGLLPEAVEIVSADLTRPESLADAVDGARLVFHLAATLDLNQRPAAPAPEVERVNVDGTRYLLAAALTAEAERFVLFSTIAVYGPSAGGAPFTEASPTRPLSLYARTKCQAEAFVLAARRPASDAPLGVVLRLAAVYGPRVKGNYARLVTALRRGWFMPIGPGLNRRTLVHEEDVASAALLAATHPQAAGQIYNVTDGGTPNFNAIVAAICAGLNRPLPRWRLPLFPLQLAAGLTEWGCSQLNRPAPLSRATVAKLQEDVAVSSDKIRRELDFQSRFDLTSGWADTLR